MSNQQYRVCVICRDGCQRSKAAAANLLERCGTNNGCDVRIDTARLENTFLGAVAGFLTRTPRLSVELAEKYDCLVVMEPYMEERIIAQHALHLKPCPRIVNLKVPLTFFSFVAPAQATYDAVRTHLREIIPEETQAS